MKKINSKQRVQLAMDMQTPDRVPLMCQFSIGFMMCQLRPHPAEFWYDSKTFADGLVTLCKKFKFDGILVSLHGHSDEWKRDLLESREIGEGRVELIYSDRKEIHSWQDLPVVSFQKEPKYKTIEEIDIEMDIPNVLNYIPVSHNLYFKLDKENLFGIFDYLIEQVGTEYSIHGEITSPFDYFLDTLGYENGLIALIMYPEKAKLILERYTRLVADLAVGMCQKEIDAIKISSPFAGMGFISTEFYEEFVLPYERTIVKQIREQGKHVYIHTCGSIGDRLELMQSGGISGLECLDPVPVGNVDLEDAFNRIGQQLFIKGNIDSVNTLLLGDEQKAEADVRKILKIGMEKGKGFILSTACSVAPLVSQERIWMLADLIEKCGYYSQTEFNIKNKNE